MTNWLLHVVLAVLLVLSATGSAPARQHAAADTGHVAAAGRYTTPAQLLGEMTAREKAGQMLIVYNSPADFLVEHGVGGVILFTNMVTDARALADELRAKQAAVRIPLLVCIDQEGGNINRLVNLECFASTLSAHRMSQLTAHDIAAIAAEVTDFLREVGININFAPCLDPVRGSACDTTYMAHRHRSFGDNPETITSKAGAFLDGAACAGGFNILQHFPGYDVATNSDVEMTHSTAPLQTIDRNLIPFANLVQRSGGVMMSNIAYDSLDSVPAVLSARVVGMARALVGDRLVITDDLWAGSLREMVAPPGADFATDLPDELFTRLVERAVLAGNDMLLITYPAKVPVMLDAITRLVAHDPAAQRLVDAAVLRILAAKQRLFPQLFRAAQ